MLYVSRLDFNFLHVKDIRIHKNIFHWNFSPHNNDKLFTYLTSFYAYVISLGSFLSLADWGKEAFGETVPERKS